MSFLCAQNRKANIYLGRFFYHKLRVGVNDRVDFGSEMIVHVLMK